MKKILSMLLAIIMILSVAVLPVSATEAGGNWNGGTLVSYDAEDPDGDGVKDNIEAYTVTVPAQLAPGAGGEVVLAGTWPSDRMVIVTADEEVILENSINPNNTKTLAVTFTTIEQEGSNISAIEVKEDVAVAGITNAIFGTWSGTFNYFVDIVDCDNVEAAGYRFMDLAYNGDYVYNYMGCGSFEEYGYGVIKIMLLESGIPCETDEDVLEQLAPLYFGCSWTDLQDQGHTPESLFEMIGMKEDYEDAKSEGYFVNGWQVLSVLDKTKTEYGTILSEIDGIPVVLMQGTFMGCKNLKTAPNIPNGVSIIGDDVFHNCTSLTSVTIPEGIASIGSSAFSYCSRLTTINFGGTIEQWNNITKGDYWNYLVPATKIICSDGEVTL